MKRSILFVLLFAVLAFAAASNSYAQSGIIKIDTIKNTQYANEIQEGQNPRFLIRLNNNTASYYDISYGFKISSPDGATWDSVTPDSVGPFNVDGENLFGLRFNQVFAFDGSFNGSATATSLDTTGMLAAATPTGTSRQLAPGYNDTCFAFTIWLNGTNNHGKHFCIDSAVANDVLWTWKWVARGTFQDTFPTFESYSGVAYQPTGTGVDRIGSGYCFMVRDPLVGVDENEGLLPKEFTVSKNYPNPFNPSTTIDYSVPRKSKVNLTVYNVLGQKVATLVNTEMAAGKYRAVWDGKADNGSTLSSGIYFYKFEADNFVKTSKMVMLK